MKRTERSKSERYSTKQGFVRISDVDCIFFLACFFLRLNYYPVKTLDEVVEVFTRETNNPEVDSVEGIMYSLNEGTVNSAKLG